MNAPNIVALPLLKQRKPAKIIREDSVIVRVFPVRSVGRALRYEARWKFGGVTHRKAFSDVRGGKSAKTRAEEFAREQALKIANGQTAGAGFTQADEQCQIRITARCALNDQRIGREEYTEVKVERLCAFDEFRHGLGLSEDEARALLAKYAPNSTRAVPAQQVVDDMLRSVTARSEAKRIRSGDVRPSTENSRKLRIRLGKFAQEFPRALQTLEPDALVAWLNAQCKSPKTWNHYRAAVMQLARFARRKKYLTEEKLNDLLNIERFEVPERVADPHTAKELSALLDRAQLTAPDFVCAIVAVAFCGFRECEVVSEKGLADYTDFDLETGEALIRAGHSKVGKNRRIPIPANARAWFKKYGKASGPLCTVKSFTIKLKRLCLKAGVKSRVNGLRAGFISHDVALRGDKGSTAQRAGTSVAKIESNYLKWPTQAAAQAWSRIEPSDLQEPLDLKFASPTRHHAPKPRELPL